jgi:hypothetical protein
MVFTARGRGTFVMLMVLIAVMAGAVEHTVFHGMARGRTTTIEMAGATAAAVLVGTVPAVAGTCLVATLAAAAAAAMAAAAAVAAAMLRHSHADEGEL